MRPTKRRAGARGDVSSRFMGSTPLPVGRDLSRLSTAWPELEVEVDDRRVGSG